MKNIHSRLSIFFVLPFEIKNQLDQALAFIEDDFMSDFTRPKPCHAHEILEGHLYLVVHKSPNTDYPRQFNYHAYRVRIEEIDSVQKRALCFYIDDGTSEWVEYETETKLFHLNYNLLQYSAQAIHFSLFNLEDFEEIAVANEITHAQLQDQRYVAKIQTTQAEFEKQLETDNSVDNRIKVIMYDTSTDDDRNVNKDIIAMTCKQMPPPQLSPRQTNVVNVTHVCDNGEVYCRLHGSKDMQAIEKILDGLTITDAHRVSAKYLMSAQGQRDIMTKLYLVQNTRNQRFYRVKILPTESPNAESFAMCRCVDYGYTRPVAFENIYNLERLSYALFGYPYQAFLVQLNGIDSAEYPADGIARMREILCCGKSDEIYLNVVVRSEWPIVEAWKTIDGVQYCMNSAIQKELQM